MAQPVDAVRLKSLQPALPDSYEHLFHQTGLPRFLLLPRWDRASAHVLRQPRLERAVGVVYRPDTERLSHYLYARMADQFDAVIHFDGTSAVEPLAPVPVPAPAMPAGGSGGKAKLSGSLSLVPDSPKKNRRFRTSIPVGPWLTRRPQAVGLCGQYAPITARVPVTQPPGHASGQSQEGTIQPIHRLAIVENG